MKETITLEEIKELYDEMNNREYGDSYFTKYDGTIISTDTGCAFGGIEFFIEELEHKLKNKQLKTSYCNRSDCTGRINNSKKYDSIQQKYEKQVNNWNELKGWLEIMKKDCSDELFQVAVEDIENKMRLIEQESKKVDSEE